MAIVAVVKPDVRSGHSDRSSVVFSVSDKRHLPSEQSLKSVFLREGIKYTLVRIDEKAKRKELVENIHGSYNGVPVEVQATPKLVVFGSSTFFSFSDPRNSSRRPSRTFQDSIFIRIPLRHKQHEARNR